ncbi:MAG: hypothetical protein AB7E48_06605 [Deferribacterales bacterium]
MTEKKRLLDELAEVSRAERKLTPDEDFAERTYRRVLAEMPRPAAPAPAFAVLVPVLCALLAVLFVTESYMTREKAIYLMELLTAGVSSVVI